MTNNDILKRLCYTFNLNVDDIINIFETTEIIVSRTLIDDWLRSENDEEYLLINDEELATFLNGFINVKRGKKDGIQPIAEKNLTNNMILRKLKIALNLTSEEIIEMYASEGKKISKHELSAFFRNSNHPKFKRLNDQYLRNFINAVQKKYCVT